MTDDDLMGELRRLRRLIAHAQEHPLGFTPGAEETLVALSVAAGAYEGMSRALIEKADEREVATDEPKRMRAEVARRIHIVNERYYLPDEGDE